MASQETRTLEKIIRRKKYHDWKRILKSIFSNCINLYIYNYIGCQETIAPTFNISTMSQNRNDCKLTIEDSQFAELIVLKIFFTIPSNQLKAGRTEESP